MVWMASKGTQRNVLDKWMSSRLQTSTNVRMCNKIEDGENYADIVEWVGKELWDEIIFKHGSLFPTHCQYPSTS